MKVGDLVKYSKEHSSRPGFDYCADWTGIIAPGDLPGTYKIYWTTQHGVHIGALVDPDGCAKQGLEVISEKKNY